MSRSKITAWIYAARLRTLPLSVSGILVGSGYALYHGSFNGLIFSMAIVTTLLLQILSNFANDYGDGVKGTDNDERLGPKRAFQSGIISRSSFKKGLIVTAVLSFISATVLILLAFGTENAVFTIGFFVLGIFAIWAAIKYTVGNSAYGYRGMGDVFVFIFFGLVSVLGSYALFSQTTDWKILISGIGIGLLSTSVLNLNNMRDYHSDKKSAKNTLVVLLGQKISKIYHIILILVGVLCLVTFYYLVGFSSWTYLSVITVFILFKHLSYVYKNQKPKDLDQELKKVALSTFAIALVFFMVQLFV